MASGLASLPLPLSPYNLFYTPSSPSDLSKTHTNIPILPQGFDITLGMKSKLQPWSLEFASASLSPSLPR